MTENPQPSPHPHIERDALIAHPPVGPQIDAQAPLGQNSVQLVNTEGSNDCSFWLGLCRPGPVEPRELIQMQSMTAIFNTASEQGVRTDAAIMLTDTRTANARFVFLKPPPTSSAARPQWIAELTTAVDSWHPERLGLYFSPHLTTEPHTSDLLQATLRQLIHPAKTKHFYLLVGAHGYNNMLNVTLQLRQQLLQQDQICLDVFH